MYQFRVNYGLAKWQESEHMMTMFKRQHGMMEECDLWEIQLNYANGYWWTCN